MELDEIIKEIITLRERVTRNESSIISLIQQQTAIDNLVTAVQELALSLKELTVKSHDLGKRVTSIEDEKKSKQMYVWTILVGGVIGAVVTKVVALFY